jgi:iron complex transport system substrate-binding protein
MRGQRRGEGKSGTSGGAASAAARCAHGAVREGVVTCRPARHASAGRVARLWPVLGLVLAAGLGLGHGAAGAADIEVQDDRGRTHRFSATPQRIVSLLPSLTESVCAVGACARLVGVDRYSNAPPQVQALPRLGGLEDAQVERIVALKPDVVLAASAARVTGRLESLGLKVLVLESQTHADVRRTLELLARVLDAPQPALQVWSAIERDIATAAARVPAALRGQRVYFEVGSGPWAAGAGSFIGETLTRLGMSNAVPADLGPFPKLSPEFVLRSRPDIVMAARREIAAMSGRPGWQGMPALVRGKVCGFESAPYELLVRPGPRLGEAALLLADCLATLPIEVSR